jgi:peptide/nickel transport system permease protein
MLETLRLDFIRTAKSKGLSFSAVVIKHGLRNALIPVVTVITVSMGLVFSGAVITETVFSYQGAGYLMFQAIQGNDFNVAMCSFVVTCSCVLFMNLVADVFYCFLDPRISYS